MLKPTYSGEGRGIIICHDEKEILQHINRDQEFYIIQKYIERPLLVYKTKFDIRQYFMITVDKEYLRCWWHPGNHLPTLDLRKNSAPKLTEIILILD